MLLFKENIYFCLMSVGIRLAAELPDLGSASAFFNLFLEELLLLAALPSVAVLLASVDLPLASLLLLLVIIILFLVSFLLSVDLLRDPLLEVRTCPSKEITLCQPLAFQELLGPRDDILYQD